MSEMAVRPQPQEALRVVRRCQRSASTCKTEEFADDLEAHPLSVDLDGVSVTPIT